MKLEVGKWYVLDRFSQADSIVSGPFDTEEDAEKDRLGMNIEDDCYSVQYSPPNDDKSYSMYMA